MKNFFALVGFATLLAGACFVAFVAGEHAARDLDEHIAQRVRTFLAEQPNDPAAQDVQMLLDAGSGSGNGGPARVLLLTDALSVVDGNQTLRPAQREMLASARRVLAAGPVRGLDYAHFILRCADVVDPRGEWGPTAARHGSCARVERLGDDAVDGGTAAVQTVATPDAGSHAAPDVAAQTATPATATALATLAQACAADRLAQEEVAWRTLHVGAFSGYPDPLTHKAYAAMVSAATALMDHGALTPADTQAFAQAHASPIDKASRRERRWRLSQPSTARAAGADRGAAAALKRVRRFVARGRALPPAGEQLAALWRIVERREGTRCRIAQQATAAIAGRAALAPEQQAMVQAAADLVQQKALADDAEQAFARRYAAQLLPRAD